MTAQITRTTSLIISQFPCLSDNYGFLVHEPKSGHSAAIDTPDAAAINAELAEQGWQLTHIFNTHWHPDHTGGNMALKEQWGCEIAGPAAERDKIPGLDMPLEDHDRCKLGDITADIAFTPGHTSGHIIYHFASEGVVFVGDTLFALGCGRLFEGSAPQMWKSLSRIAQMAEETLVFCAHEYTEANAAFAVTIEENNEQLQQRVAEIACLRAAGKPTIPTTIGLEMQTNPFMRADQPDLARSVDMAPDSAAHDIFAEIRRRKDVF